MRIFAGSTDVGLWVTKQLRDLGDIVYIGQIESFKHVETTDEWIEIGAGVSVDRAYAELVKIYPDLEETVSASRLPTRNAGTRGGNVTNGSSIGDSMPGLIALNARVVLQSVNGLREMPLENLYIAYQKDMAENEFVAAIRVPTCAGKRAKLQFRAYKLSNASECHSLCRELPPDETPVENLHRCTFKMSLRFRVLDLDTSKNTA